jgi:hypothetical protein
MVDRRKRVFSALDRGSRTADRSERHSVARSFGDSGVGDADARRQIGATTAIFSVVKRAK